MRFLRTSSLSWFFLALFLATLVGQAIAGQADLNDDERTHAELLGERPETLGFWRYVGTSHFWQGVMENWQSEYLQFTVFILATVWLVQRGSPESKEPGQAGTESPQKQRLHGYAPDDAPGWARLRGVRGAIYQNSLLIVMGLIFAISWFAHSVTGWSQYNADQIEHGAETVSWVGYLGNPDFWWTTFQNWQSEMLAVGSMVVLSIYLRQRGSPESKPVGAPHEATGVEG